MLCHIRLEGSVLLCRAFFTVLGRVASFFHSWKISIIHTRSTLFCEHVITAWNLPQSGLINCGSLDAFKRGIIHVNLTSFLVARSCYSLGQLMQYICLRVFFHSYLSRSCYFLVFEDMMLVLGLGLVLKESLRTIFVSLALALVLRLKSLALALALQQVLVIVLECNFFRR